MGCGTCSKQKTYEVVEAVVETAKDKVEEVIDTVTDKARAVKLRGVPLDEEVQALAAKVKEKCNVVDEVANTYRDWASVSSNVLLLPSLSIWSSKEGFPGGKAAAVALHRHAVHQAELSRLTLDCRASVARDCVAELREAEKLLKTCLESVCDYEDAELAAH